MRFLLALAFIVLCAYAYDSPSPEELTIRRKLGIPDTASQVLFLGQTSHMDWDWVNTYPDYYYSKVEEILAHGFTLVENNYQNKPDYHFAVSEVGFYEKFLAENPSKASRLVEISDKFRSLGIGITTPDNLLPNGEVFIRNYLVGKSIVLEHNLSMSYTSWMPDDFGHDTQLPVVLKAMGLNSTSVSRVPGKVVHQITRTLDNSPSVVEQLQSEGTDFYWRATDGSTILTHIMLYHYNQGDVIDGGRNDKRCNMVGSNFDIYNRKLKEFISTESKLARTPYMFIPIGDDFALPKTCLWEVSNVWNNKTNTDFVFVIPASYDDFITLVAAYDNAHQGETLDTKPFYAVPYWTGFYTTRPFLKLSHEESYRYLATAETFSIFDGRTADQIAHLKNSWRALTPSTHHDFITGTAPDRIYFNEQVPYMHYTLRSSKKAMDIPLDHISAKLNEKGKITSAVLFNALGFDYNGFVSLELPKRSDVNVAIINNTKIPMALTGEGLYTFKTSIPALGYSVVHFARDRVEMKDAITMRTNKDGKVVMENKYLTVFIDTQTNKLDSVIDKTTNRVVVNNSMEVLFYHDGGNIYRFGNEIRESCPFRLANVTAKSTYSIIDSGPLITTYQGTTRFKKDQGFIDYTFEYSLRSDDDQLIVKINGGAPKTTSVLVSFELESPVKDVKYGTPYHHDSHFPVKYWRDFTFHSIHNYLALIDGDNKIMTSFAQSSIRGWAFEKGNNKVYAALYRNTPSSSCANYGADGSDYENYTYEFAIQGGSGLTKENLHRRALTFNTKPNSRVIQRSSFAPIESVSLFHFEENDGPIITAAKHGEFKKDSVIVRFYAEVVEGEPKSSKLISLNAIASVKVVNALEDPIDDDSVIVSIVDDHTLSITQKYAIGTVEIVFK